MSAVGGSIRGYSLIWLLRFSQKKAWIALGSWGWGGGGERGAKFLRPQYPTAKEGNREGEGRLVAGTEKQIERGGNCRNEG